MSPESKANELVDKFYWETSKGYEVNRFTKNGRKSAIKCAIIAVEEIIKFYGSTAFNYWEDVLKELKKLK